MLVKLITSGGFVGAARDATVDTSTLNQSDLDLLARLLNALDLKGASQSSGRAGSERKQFELEVHSGSEVKCYRTVEGGETAEFKALFNWMNRHCR